LGLDPIPATTLGGKFYSIFFFFNPSLSDKITEMLQIQRNYKNVLTDQIDVRSFSMCQSLPMVAQMTDKTAKNNSSLKLMLSQPNSTQPNIGIHKKML
jgi:hypothetical protein